MLEAGDPPMGVAFGEFYPTANYEGFRHNQPFTIEEPGSKRWNGLSLQKQHGQHIECTDVTLLDWRHGEDVELEVTAFGISYQEYGSLFPNHVQAYKDQFK